MADGVQITAGSGTTIKTDDLSGAHVQYMKLMDGTDNGTGVIPGDAANGLDVDVTRLPATVGAVDESAPASDTASSGLNGRLQRVAQRLTSLIALIPASLGQKTMANGLAVTVASDQSALTVAQSTPSSLKVEPAGNVAHDGVDSGNPVKVGGRASNAVAAATMVASADRTDAVFDLDGIQLVKQGCPVANIIRHHGSVTATTSTAATAFGATAGTRNLITSVIVHNSSAVDTFVELQDGSGGTTFCVISAPQKGGAVVTFPVPLPQPTANTGLFFKENAAATTVYVTIVGYQTKAG